MKTKAPDVQFQQLGQKDYKKIIASPSQSQAYFDAFHRPLITAVREKFGRPNNALSVACGYGHELVFFKRYKDLQLFGVDLNRDMLLEAVKSSPKTIFETWDVRGGTPRFIKGRFHMSFAVNALIYCPSDMAAFMHESLMPGGLGVTNLRIGGEPLNQPFFDDCIKNGCTDDTERIKAGGYTFVLRAMDYTVRQDKLQRLGRQLYFQTERDAQDFFAVCGFDICSQKVYQYPSDENERNTVQVFTLQKP